ncbi:MAG TPA: energy transducer TonB [Pyrinomonadaceae bacterium]|nr:energy transducer TonB [Pyrinomonadaceae bacterium]
MTANNSSAKRTYEYQPTIIESRLLIRRLAVQLAFLENELKRSWFDFRTDPVVFIKCSTQNVFFTLKKIVSTPNTRYACATALMAFTGVAILGFLLHSAWFPVGDMVESPGEVPVELVLLDVASPPDDPGVGKKGGNSLSVSQKPFQGRSGGGDRNPLPPQHGKMPPPSIIPAAIPITPPVNPPSLPVAGIDIDPSLWKDVEAKVFGDPDSKSNIPSSGPGDGGGIGTGSGPGIGNGFGAGGPGCGSVDVITGRRRCVGNYATLRQSEVDQRARLLFKPEPQYTEDARRNQITGTVMLRVVFSSEGEVDQIRAVRTLPFGLTERAIAAARQIKFVPAMKGGLPVSVHMQLEYNFNLY